MAQEHEHAGNELQYSENTAVVLGRFRRLLEQNLHTIGAGLAASMYHSKAIAMMPPPIPIGLEELSADASLSASDEAAKSNFTRDMMKHATDSNGPVKVSDPNIDCSPYLRQKGTGKISTEAEKIRKDLDEGDQNKRDNESSQQRQNHDSTQKSSAKSESGYDRYHRKKGIYFYDEDVGGAKDIVDRNPPVEGAAEPSTVELISTMSTGMQMKQQKSHSHYVEHSYDPSDSYDVVLTDEAPPANMKRHVSPPPPPPRRVVLDPPSYVSISLGLGGEPKAALYGACVLGVVML